MFKQLSLNCNQSGAQRGFSLRKALLGQSPTKHTAPHSSHWRGSIQAGEAAFSRRNEPGHRRLVNMSTDNVADNAYSLNVNAWNDIRKK